MPRLLAWIAARRTELALGTLAALMPILAHLWLFSGDAILYTADTAQLQYPRYRILCDSLQKDGALPLWQTWLYGGSPFHANPENPTLYPPILFFASFCSPIWTMNLTVLLHLSLSAIGMFALVRRLWRRVDGEPAIGNAAACVAAFVFALNYFTRVDHLNLVAYGAAHALIPWILLAVDSMLNEARPMRWAGVLAILLSMQVFTGGLYVLPYSMLLVAIWILFLGLLGGRERRARAIRCGLIAAGIAFLIVLAKVIPASQWLPTTNRHGRLPYEEALGTTLGGSGSFAWGEVWKKVSSYTAGGLALIPAALAFALVRHAIVRVVLGGALFFFAVGLGGPVHRFLYDWVPLFNEQRSAVRAWTGVNPLLAIAAGLGTGWLIGRIPKLNRSTLAISVAGALVALAMTPSLLASHRADRVLDKPFSFRELLTRYTHWPEAAQRCGKDARAVFFDRTEPEGRNEQFITSALGVETTSGYLGHVWPALLERHVFGPEGARLSSLQRQRHLGTLSVRCLVTRTPSIPPADGYKSIFPPGVDGTDVVDNAFARPRAFVPKAVCALYGDFDRALTYALLDHADFPIRDASVLAIHDNYALMVDEVAALDEVVLITAETEPSDAAEETARLAAEANVRVTRLHLPPDEAGRAEIDAIARRMSVRAAERHPSPATFLRRNAEISWVVQPDVDDGRFVVVSEPWSWYAGWTAEPYWIHSADAVSSAVFLPAGDKAFRAKYSPTSVTFGLWIGGLGVVLALWVLWRGR